MLDETFSGCDNYWHSILNETIYIQREVPLIPTRPNESGVVLLHIIKRINPSLSHTRLDPGKRCL